MKICEKFKWICLISSKIRRKYRKKKKNWIFIVFEFENLVCLSDNFHYNKKIILKKWFWMVSSSVEQLLCQQQDSGTMWILVTLRNAFIEFKKGYKGNKFRRMGDQNANFEEEMRNRQQEIINGGCSSSDARQAFQKQRSK